VQALETTLRHIVFEEWDKVPAYRMLLRTKEEIRLRAEELFKSLDVELVDGESVLGGGSTPGQSLPTTLAWVKGNAQLLERELRGFDRPVIARIEDDRLLIDLRTVDVAEEPALRAAVRQAQQRSM